MSILVLFWGKVCPQTHVLAFPENVTIVDCVESFEDCSRYAAVEVAHIVLIGNFTNDCRQYMLSRLRKPDWPGRNRPDSQLKIEHVTNPLGDGSYLGHAIITTETWVEKKPKDPLATP